MSISYSPPQFSVSHCTILDEEMEECERRESLPPPQPSGISWREYIESTPGSLPALGTSSSTLDNSFRTKLLIYIYTFSKINFSSPNPLPLL